MKKHLDNIKKIPLWSVATCIAIVVAAFHLIKMVVMLVKTGAKLHIPFNFKKKD